MNLLAHNMLTSNIIRGVTKGYPLIIQPREVEVREVYYDPDYVARTIPKIDWSALRQAAQQVGQCEELPEEVPEEYETNDDFLKRTHHALMQVELIEGDLICPETGRKFPVVNGVPNMSLTEEEL